MRTAAEWEQCEKREKTEGSGDRNTAVGAEREREHERERDE